MANNFWLLKSEPNVFSFQQLLTDGATVWDGVRNHQAKNFLKQMELADLALFYHSNIQLAVVGVCKITQPHFHDPTDPDGKWLSVLVEPIIELNKPVSLKTLKSEPEFADLLLIKQSRLSVMPISESHFYRILEIGETVLHN